MADEEQARIDAAHRAATARGEDGYADPRTGAFVFTAPALLRTGSCCGSGCRHCPFDGDDTPEPGNTVS